MVLLTGPQGLQGAELCAGAWETWPCEAAGGKGTSGSGLAVVSFWEVVVPGRVWAGGAEAAPEAWDNVHPTVLLWSYLALLDIDPGRPLVDSLIEN